MAKRHNEYSRLLGTVENNIVPLKEQGAMPGMGMNISGQAIPTANVPSLEAMANTCDAICETLTHHSDQLRAMASMQSNMADDIGLPTEVY